MAPCLPGPLGLTSSARLPEKLLTVAVRELERAITHMGLKGVSVSTNVDGRELARAQSAARWSR